MREIQYGPRVVDGAENENHMGGAADTSGHPAATLTAMQAATLSTMSTIDSAVLRDFGDGHVFEEKGKEKEKEHNEPRGETQSGSGHSVRSSRSDSESKGNHAEETSCAAAV